MIQQANKISWIALLGLSCLPILRICSLTWLEILRLLVIALGMLYVYARMRKETRASSSKTSPFDIHKSFPIFLALVYIFILIQFDPATSSLHDMLPQRRLNWFFLSSTGLILLAGSALLAQKLQIVKNRTSRKGKRTFSLTLPDKIAIIVGFGAIVLSLISKSIFNSVKGMWTDYPGVVKIGECLILWFIVTRTVSNHLGQKSGASPSQPHMMRFPGMLLKILSLIFMVLIIAGGIQSTLAFYYLNLGHSFYERNELQGAKGKYQKAQEIGRLLHFPSLRDGWLQKLAIIYLREDSTAQAKRIMGEIRRCGRDPESIHKKAGDILFETENWADAINHYNAYLHSKRKNGQVLNNVAWCYVRLKDLQGLSSFVSRYDHQFYFPPLDYQSALLIGRYYLSTGLNEDALQCFQEADRLHPYRFESQYWLGLTLQRLKRWEESIQYFRSAIEAKPEFGEAHYLLGLGLEMTEQSEEAIEKYRKVIELQPTHSNALIALEQYYWDKGLKDNARDLHRREHVMYASEMEGATNPFRKGEDTLWTNYSVFKMCRLHQGTTIFRITAKGSSPFQNKVDEGPDFDASAHMVVLLDNMIIGEADVPPGEWTTHSFVTYGNAGQHRLMIQFTNDIHEPDQKKDRDLVIDRVVVQTGTL